MTSRSDDYLEAPGGRWESIMPAVDSHADQRADSKLSADSGSLEDFRSRYANSKIDNKVATESLSPIVCHHHYTSQPRPQIHRPSRERGVDVPPSRPPHKNSSKLPPCKPHRAASREKIYQDQNNSCERYDSQENHNVREGSEKHRNSRERADHHSGSGHSKRSYFELDLSSLGGGSYSDSQHSRVSSITSDGGDGYHHHPVSTRGVMKDEYTPTRHDADWIENKTHERRLCHEYQLDDSGQNHSHSDATVFREDRRWSDRSHQSNYSYRPEWTQGVVDDMPRKPTRNKVFGYEQDYLEDEEAYQAHINALLGETRCAERSPLGRSGTGCRSDPFQRSSNKPAAKAHASSTTHSLVDLHRPVVVQSRAPRHMRTKKDPLRDSIPLVEAVYRYPRQEEQQDRPGKPPRRQASNTDENTQMVEVYPGHSVPLRGRQETTEAVAQEFYVPATCFACETSMFCIANAELVLCPTCKSINPLVLDFCDWPQHGCGLGITPQALQTMRDANHGTSDRRATSRPATTPSRW